MAKSIEQEIALTPEPTWWGITIGSLVYATFAPDRETALNLTFEAIGVPRTNEVPIFTHVHDSEYQQPLTDRFGDEQRAVRVKHFSMEPYSREPRT